MQRQHLVPIDDLREHEPSCDCWCRPFVDPLDDCVLRHNSMDGREAYECGERKPS